MDACLGEKRILTDIGGITVGRTIEQLVQCARDMGKTLQALQRNTDFKTIGKFGLQ